MSGLELTGLVTKHDPASSQPRPNPADRLALDLVGWQESQRVHMVYTAGPCRWRAHPRRSMDAL